MTIETLKLRIEGKAKEIAKLEKKIERIEAAKATNWEKNPYYYSERDLTWAERDLFDARKALVDYSDQLKMEYEKKQSRNVKVILDFLQAWKDRNMKFYVNTLPAYIEAKHELDRQMREITDTSNSLWKIADRQERARVREENDKRYYSLRKEFRSAWNWIEFYVISKWDGSKREYILDTEKLEKELNTEADRKYDFIIERTNEIVGEITDAGNLKIGAKGDLNGYVIGTRGRATIKTIGAGGYNIQCFHFRTLIHELKEV